MIHKNYTKILIIIILLAAWYIFAQSCLRMRISDNKAKKKFAYAGVSISTEILHINDFNLHFAKVGNDSLPTLLFLHGSPGSWYSFQDYMKDKDLLAMYRMVSIDRPGFGFSQFGDAKNLAEQSVIISPLLAHLQNHQPLYIIGHSLGGPLAVKIVADNPGSFAGMILLAASVDPAEEAPEKWRGFLYNSPLQQLMPGAFKPSNAEIWYLKKDLPLLSKQFASITCSVWILHGDKDNFVPVGNAAYAKKMLVNAAEVHIQILPGASHFIPWQPWYKYVKETLLHLNE